LKPGGVLLATFPSASRVCLEYGRHGDYWRMTPSGARALLESAFTPSQISCEPYGNVLTNTAFLHGLSTAEISDSEFDQADPYFPMLTGVRAKKAAWPSLSGARGVVLLYHRVNDVPDAYGLGVPPAIFESQLQWLQSECRIVALEELLSSPPEQLPSRAVAVTFDDGYEDNLRGAIPILQRVNAPATFFLTARWLEGHGEYWWDTLERVLLSETAVPASLDLTWSGLPMSFATRSVEDRRETHAQLHDRLVHASLEQRDHVVERLREWSGAGTIRFRPMVADEVRQLAAIPGVTIGAHTVNHLSLPDNAGLRLSEMTDCQVQLRRVAGRPVEMFAYPYGAVDRETLAQARRFWRWGLSCDDGVLAESFDAARVPRLDVKPWPVTTFAERVSRLLEPVAPPRRRTLTLSP